MTTVAWDGTTLAADRQTTSCGTPTRTHKVFKAKREGSVFLYACAGHTGQCQAFTRWVNGECGKPTFNDFGIIAIDQRRRVWVADHDLTWELKGTNQWALGSGADYALGAMLAGATAVQAVRIASRLNVNTGMGVDWVRL